MDSETDSGLQQQIKEVMQVLPLPIRHYLREGKYSRVAQRLTGKYSLHVDQGGILERELMLLLMGIETPDEFAASLKSEGQISEDTVFAIMTDVNQEVFIPLQEQMRTGESSGDAPGIAVSSAPPTPFSVTKEPQTHSIASPQAAPSGIAPLPPKHALPPFPIGGPLRPTASEPPVNLPGALGPLPASTPVQPAPREQFQPPAPINRLAPPPLSAGAPIEAGPVSPPPPMESYPVDPYRETPE